MKEDIEIKQDYACDPAEVDSESLTYAYLEEYGFKAVGKAKDVKRSEIRAGVRPSSKGERLVYEFLYNVGLLDKRSKNYYRIEAGKNELDLFSDQLDEIIEDE